MDRYYCRRYIYRNPNNVLLHLICPSSSRLLLHTGHPTKIVLCFVDDVSSWCASLFIYFCVLVLMKCSPRLSLSFLPESHVYLDVVFIVVVVTLPVEGFF